MRSRISCATATTASTSCWSRSAARSATSRACRSSRRSASSATTCRAARRSTSTSPCCPSSRRPASSRPSRPSTRSRSCAPSASSPISCSAAPTGRSRPRHAAGLDTEVLAAFGIAPTQSPELERWETINNRIHNPEGDVTIAIVGKYTGLKDAYKSLIEALSHGGIANKIKVKLDWIESEVFEREDPTPFLEHVNGILVPGGFGQRGAEGKIRAAQFARERQVPYFGICFGMQMAVIEAARNLCGVDDANSTEFGATSEPVVGLMTEWMKGNELHTRGMDGDLGGTMRLGAYAAMLARGSRAAELYDSSSISERHRHRYEVNTGYNG